MESTLKIIEPVGSRPPIAGPGWPSTGELEKAVIDQMRYLIRHPDVIAHTYREVCAGSQTGPDPEVLAQLEELRQSRQQTHLAARSLLDLKDPDGPLVKSELKRLNEQMKRPDDSIRNLESATTSTSTVDLAEIIHAISRLDLLSEFLPSFETPPRLLTPSGDRGTR